jgi:hypothetical protein
MIVESEVFPEFALLILSVGLDILEPSRHHRTKFYESLLGEIPLHGIDLETTRNTVFNSVPFLMLAESHF